jgi:hypothetical protein
MDAIHQANIRQQQQQQQAPQNRSTTQSEDMELARAIQEVEISNQGENGFQDQLDYARRVQEQAFAKVDRNRGSPRSTKRRTWRSADGFSYSAELC